jgi:repressor LexA
VYIHGHGFSPTYQEICDHFGFASFNSVQRYLKQLEAKQYVQLPWGNQKRAITILRPSSAVRDSLDSIAPQTHVETVVRQPHADKLSNVSPAILNNASLQLPLLGRVAAGVPLEAYEHDEFIDVPASLVRHAERTYALRVQGDSMIDDGILDGDVILVQRQSTAQNGDIVVAVINEEATVKRFYKHTSHSSTDHAKGGSSGRAGQIELRPANATMSPMWFDANQVQLRGVVVGLIRRFS